MSKSVTVAYQGEPGAYSEAAAHDAFQPTGLTVNAIGHTSFDEVFRALATSAVDYAAVPVENTLGGSIHVNYDLMLRYHGRVHILGEHNFRVRHTLLALPGVKKTDIKKAMSHPQALAQTECYLREAGIQPLPAYDTAGSAKLVREQGLRDTAAIASARAASVHGLEVLDFGIEDDVNNFTRFLILGRSGCEIPDGVPAKTSVVFVPMRNEVGVLHKALSCFAQRDIDLSKIESRPFRAGDLGLAVADPMAVSESPTVSRSAAKRPRPSEVAPQEVTAQFEYAFYLDLLATGDAPKCLNAFRHLEEIARFVKVLGTFPRDGLLLPTPIDAASKTAMQPLARMSLECPLRIAVVGFGTFGQFLARRWVRRGHVVYAQSRTDYSEIASSMGVRFVTSVAELADEPIDCVVLSVSILSFEKVCKGLPADFLRGKLVVDMLSVKQHAKAVMVQTMPADSDLLCMHPMFGPDSGKNSWHGLPCVYEHARVADFHRAARFLSLFENEGCKMVRMPCEQHDTLAAGSQFVTHLTGRLLSKLHLKQSPIATKGFKALLNLVDNTCSDSFDLFYALYAHNPASSLQLRQFSDAFDELRRDLLVFDTSVPNGGGGSADDGAPPNPAMKISKLVSSLALSKTVAVSDKAAALKSAGKKVVSLSVGEPDGLPAPEAMEAAHEALNGGKVKYTECGGMRALRDEICAYLQREKGLRYKPTQIVCSNGGKQALMQAMLALINPGDEVIVPAPYWVSYTQIAQLCGGKSVTISTRESDGYCLMPQDLEAAITPASRILIMCNPSNPTGAVHPAALLEKIADVLRKWPRITVIADEIYEQITYDEPHVAFATLPGMYERTVMINGFSKGPAMTGFRLGYIAGPEVLASACTKVQSQNTTSPCQVSQLAGIAALRDVKPAWLREQVAGYRHRRDYVVSRLQAMPGVTHAYMPQGAFYAFPTVHGCFGKKTPSGTVVKDAEGVCLYLLDECLLALVPGEAFGDGACVRLSYAASMETLTDALDKMERGLRNLQ